MEELTEDKLSFDVTRCRYAEMYQSQLHRADSTGISQDDQNWRELGAMLSCNRDFALIQGFNPDVTLTREQTIMQGAAFCPFRYVVKSAVKPEH